MSNYHPDRGAHLGPELQELAKRKAQAINRAYADLLAQVHLAEVAPAGHSRGQAGVQRLMQQHGIRACGKRHFRVTTTDSRHDLFSREVVGWSMPPDMHCSLAIDALEMDVISVVPNQGD